MCAQGTASAFLPKSHLPKLSSSEDQRGEGAGRMCCPPRQDDAPQLILQVAGAAARPAGLRSSGPLWLLGIWITYSWLLQPYAEQLCWKIYTWATWNATAQKPWAGHPCLAELQHHVQSNNTAHTAQLQTLSGLSSSKSQPEFVPCSATMKDFTYALRETQTRANCLVPSKTTPVLHRIQNDWVTFIYREVGQRRREEAIMVIFASLKPTKLYSLYQRNM